MLHHGCSRGGLPVLVRIVLIAMMLVPALPRAAEQPPATNLPSGGMTPDAAAKIPDAKKIEIADQDLKSIRKAVDRVAGRAEEARTEKDIGKLNCLNAQLTQMKGLGKVATQANEALVDSIAKKDPATANTQFARVVIATDKVAKSASDADVCLGQLAFLVDGQTQVQVEQPSGLPGQDVTQRAPPPPAAPTPPVVRPPPASKYY
jgi:hypothetical protein